MMKQHARGATRRENRTLMSRLDDEEVAALLEADIAAMAPDASTTRVDDLDNLIDSWLCDNDNDTPTADSPHNAVLPSPSSTDEDHRPLTPSKVPLTFCTTSHKRPRTTSALADDSDHVRATRASCPAALSFGAISLRAPASHAGNRCGNQPPREDAAHRTVARPQHPADMEVQHGRPADRRLLRQPVVWEGRAPRLLDALKAVQDA